MKKFAEKIEEGKQILDKFSKEKIEYALNQGFKVVMEDKDEDFYNEYFIEILPDEELENVKDDAPSEVLSNSSELEYFIERAFSDMFDEAFEEAYQILGLDLSDIKFIFDVNNEIYDELDQDAVIDEFTSDVYKFLDNKRADIIVELEEMGIIRPDVLDPSEIVDVDDEIGSTFELNSTLDYDNRDAALVDIGGTVLIGENGQSHAQVIQDWFDTFAEEDDYEESFNPELKSKWHRPNTEEVENLTGAEYCAFGHVLDENIFLETYTFEGISTDDVIADIDKAGITYDKVYEYANNEISRVAKVIK